MHTQLMSQNDINKYPYRYRYASISIHPRTIHMHGPPTLTHSSNTVSTSTRVARVGTVRRAGGTTWQSKMYQGLLALSYRFKIFKLGFKW